MFTSSLDWPAFFPFLKKITLFEVLQCTTANPIYSLANPCFLQGGLVVDLCSPVEASPPLCGEHGFLLVCTLVLQLLLQFKYCLLIATHISWEEGIVLEVPSPLGIFDV